MTGYFITGGAGFLGRALIADLQDFAPDALITVYSRDEAKHAVCRRLFPSVRYILGDVRDLRHMSAAMAGHEVVIHMAAMKYVPQAEVNVRECIAVNVQGSQNVVTAALQHGVERVVGISTDKVCEPVNIYGVTKLLMERIFQEADALQTTRFNLVRYGNVVSSTGSVVPLFLEQARAGRITLTDPQMTRFWLTVQQAVALVFRAIYHTDGGIILVPRLPALSMGDLVVAAMTFTEAVESAVEVVITGHRLGEKTAELLLATGEVPFAALMAGNTPGLPWPVMEVHPTTRPERAEMVHDAQARGVFRIVRGPYTSDNPDKVLSHAEFTAMISEVMQ